MLTPVAEDSARRTAEELLAAAKTARLAGKLEEALGLYSDVLRASPPDAAAHMARISIEGLEERLAEVLAARAAADADAATVAALDNLNEALLYARAARQTGSLTLALLANERAYELAQHPTETTRTLSSWGATLRRANRADEARTKLEESLLIDPSPRSNSASFASLIGALADLNRLDDAVVVAERGLAGAISDPFILRAAGRALRELALKQRNPALAARAEECFAKAAPTIDDADLIRELRVLADVYRQLGEKDRTANIDAWLQRIARSVPIDE